MVGGTNLSLHMPASHFTAKTAGCEVEISSGSPPLCHIGAVSASRGFARAPRETPHPRSLCHLWVTLGHPLTGLLSVVLKGVADGWTQKSGDM